MVQVHPNALKHGLPAEDITHAWENYVIGATRIPGEREVRIGYSASGKEIEMVGVLLASGDWLVYHALSPVSKGIIAEINRHQKRGEV